MDFCPIVARVWGSLGCFIPAVLLIGLLKSPWAKDYIGISLIELFAHYKPDRHRYHRLYNVTLATHCAHVQNLKRRHDPTAERQCPKCSSALLMRTAKSERRQDNSLGMLGVPKSRTLRSL
jgi:uncharacterized paraquat-inducible protein A